MQLTASFAALLFTLATASAAALPQNAGSGTGFENTCGVSSFVPVTGPASEAPTLDSCYKLRDNAPKTGPWRIDAPKQLAKFGDCAFSAQPVNAGEHGYIGTSDIHDLVQDAIQKWQQGSTTAVKGTITKQVGTAGDMPCDSKKGVQVQIAWTLGRA